MNGQAKIVDVATIVDLWRQRGGEVRRHHRTVTRLHIVAVAIKHLDAEIWNQK